MLVAVLMLGSCAGASTSNDGQATATSAAAGPSADFVGLVDIDGGREMYIECRGAGSPTVVLVAGLRGSAEDWHITTTTPPAVFPQVATFTRVCAYDRPGTPVGEEPSRSDPSTQPTTAAAAAADLHALLQAAGETGPYVLVGHSFGGLVAKLYTQTYPTDVAGLVLVDALSEGLQDAMTPAQWEIERTLINGDLSESLAEYPDLEQLDTDSSFEEVRAAPPLQPLPLVVLSADQPWGPILPEMIASGAVSASIPPDFGYVVDEAQQQSQAALAQLTPNAKHVTNTNSGHFIQHEQPQLVIDAIREVVDTVRRQT